MANKKLAGNSNLPYYNLEILTTTACNMNCTYCFEGHKPTDKGIVNKNKEQYFETIDNVQKQDWFKKEYSGILITFWGGEPTVNTEIMVNIINRYAEATNIKYYLYTNGYQTNKFINFIEDLKPEAISKLQIQVSYDGYIVNDKYRLTYGKKSTRESVLETFEYLTTIPIDSLNFKQTLPIEDCDTMYETWNEFKDIHYYYIKMGNKVKCRELNIGYSPTIDSFGDIDIKYLEDFKKSINDIARGEIDFYNKNGRFLMTWFGGAGNKQNCVTGRDMSVIDEDGEMYACHGVLYLDDKKDHSMGNYKDITSLEDSRKEYVSFINTKNEECENCVATACFVCPTTVYGKSNKESKAEKWTDRFANGLCDFYKYFGTIDRSMQNYLYR